jgi:hypothetical protein
MIGTVPSNTKVLNYGLIAFLIALPLMVLLYEWVI